MEYKDFSKNDLMKILELIQAAVHCRTEADIAAATARLKELVSAEMGICCLGNATTGKIEKYINLNYPLEWLTMYAENALYKHDPIVRYNYSFFEPQFWTTAAEVFNEQPSIELMNNASEFGLKYGVASGVDGVGAKGRGSLISFSSRQNIFTDYELKILDVITPHIHQALVRICEIPAGSSSAQQLSEREVEVLKWMKSGKTNWEISMILNISERTVKFHVQNIERKLDAVNKAHAVAIAMDTGLVV